MPILWNIFENVFLLPGCNFGRMHIFFLEKRANFLLDPLEKRHNCVIFVLERRRMFLVVFLSYLNKSVL